MFEIFVYRVKYRRRRGDIVEGEMKNYNIKLKMVYCLHNPKMKEVCVVKKHT